MMKCIYVCPHCHAFYGSERSKAAEECPECSAVLFETDINFDEFVAMSAEDRELCKKEYVQKHFAEANSETYGGNQNVGFVPLPNSSWVDYLNAVAWIELIAVVIGSLVLMANKQMALGIGIIAAGAFSSGVIFLMCTIAKDVRHIRNQIDRYDYEKNYKK